MYSICTIGRSLLCLDLLLDSETKTRHFHFHFSFLGSFWSNESDLAITPATAQSTCLSSLELERREVWRTEMVTLEDGAALNGKSFLHFFLSVSY